MLKKPEQKCAPVRGGASSFIHYCKRSEVERSETERRPLSCSFCIQYSDLDGLAYEGGVCRKCSGGGFAGCVSSRVKRAPLCPCCCTACAEDDLAFSYTGHVGMEFLVK